MERGRSINSTSTTTRCSPSPTFATTRSTSTSRSPTPSRRSPTSLQRRIVLTQGPGATAGSYAVVTFANLAPTQSELPELPFADWGLDNRNDFGAVWDAASGSVVQFHPSGRGDVHTLADVLSPAPVDYGSLDALLARTDNDPTAAATFAAGIDTEYGSGTYAAITTLPPAAEHQVGFDSTPLFA